MSNFGVFLQSEDGQKRFETIEAQTRGLAAKAAVALRPGWQPIAVIQRTDVTGICDKCHAVIFDDEQPRRVRGNRLRCFEC